MNNYKIKVNETNSKEIQELLFELGYEWAWGKEIKDYPIEFDCILFCCDKGVSLVWGYSKERPTKKELTLPQLRDLVVLHRNDVNDANCTYQPSGTNEVLSGYLTSDDWYYLFTGGSWQKHISTQHEAANKFTPIQKPHPELMEEMSEVKEWLDPDDNYSYHKCAVIAQGSGWVELPEGTEVVRKNLQGSLNFYKKIDGHWALKNKVDMNNWYQPKPYSSHFDADDGSLPIIWQRHAKHSVGALLDGLDELREEYKDYPKQLEQGLISGADALRALADGKEVEFLHDSHGWISALGLNIEQVIGVLFKLRLKPLTITLSLEIPAPFEPKEGEEFFILSPLSATGYTKVQGITTQVLLDEYVKLGAWRTEEEIKQVVAALRGIKG